MTAKQIEKEVQRQAVLFEEKCLTGQVLQGNTRFAEFAEEWLSAKADELRPRTLDRYKAMIPIITAALGHMKLSSIQPHHLQAFYKNLAEEGIRQDIKYCACVDFKKLLEKRKLSIAKAGQLVGVSASTIITRILPYALDFIFCCHTFSVHFGSPFLLFIIYVRYYSCFTNLLYADFSSASINISSYVPAKTECTTF